MKLSTPKQATEVAYEYNKDKHGEDTIADEMIDWLGNTLGLDAVIMLYGGLKEMNSYVLKWLEENQPADTPDMERQVFEPEEDFGENDLEESLKYPIKSYSRKTSRHSIKRGSPVSAESDVSKELRMILDIEDSVLYNLVDESTEEILYTDIISKEEAEKRNNALEDKQEGFKWIIA